MGFFTFLFMVCCIWLLNINRDQRHTIERLEAELKELRSDNDQLAKRRLSVPQADEAPPKRGAPDVQWFAVLGAVLVLGGVGMLLPSLNKTLQILVAFGAAACVYLGAEFIKKPLVASALRGLGFGMAALCVTVFLAKSPLGSGVLALISLLAGLHTHQKKDAPTHFIAFFGGGLSVCLLGAGGQAWGGLLLQTLLTVGVIFSLQNRTDVEAGPHRWASEAIAWVPPLSMLALWLSLNEIPNGLPLLWVPLAMGAAAALLRSPRRSHARMAALATIPMALLPLLGAHSGQEATLMLLLSSLALWGWAWRTQKDDLAAALLAIQSGVAIFALLWDTPGAHLHWSLSLAALPALFWSIRRKSLPLQAVASAALLLLPRATEVADLDWPEDPSNLLQTSLFWKQIYLLQLALLLPWLSSVARRAMLPLVLLHFWEAFDANALLALGLLLALPRGKWARLSRGGLIWTAALASVLMWWNDGPLHEWRLGGVVLLLLLALRRVPDRLTHVRLGLLLLVGIICAVLPQNDTETGLALGSAILFLIGVAPWKNARLRKEAWWVALPFFLISCAIYSVVHLFEGGDLSAAMLGLAAVGLLLWWEKSEASPSWVRLYGLGLIASLETGLLLNELDNWPLVVSGLWLTLGAVVMIWGVKNASITLWRTGLGGLALGTLIVVLGGGNWSWGTRGAVLAVLGSVFLLLAQKTPGKLPASLSEE